MGLVGEMRQNQDYSKEKICLRRVNYANALILDASCRQVLLVKNGNADSYYWSYTESHRITCREQYEFRFLSFSWAGIKAEKWNDRIMKNLILQFEHEGCSQR